MVGKSLSGLCALWSGTQAIHSYARWQGEEPGRWELGGRHQQTCNLGRVGRRGYGVK